jgi:hypothetical protein
LRKRVAWASAALGLVMCVLFGLGVVYVADDYEYILAKEILRARPRITDCASPTACPRTCRARSA